jgi:hypothetical protein
MHAVHTHADILPCHVGTQGGAWPGPRPRTAVIVGHPGHELRVYGLLETLRPTVFVLTDGSGQSSTSRVGSTMRLLERAGAAAGSICGRFPDRVLYEAILHADWELCESLSAELCLALIRERVELVLCDALEGFCSVHELAHLLAQAAVRRAQPYLSRPITLTEFPVVNKPLDAAELNPHGDLWLELEAETLHRKLHMARGYPEIAREVEETLHRFGLSPFRCEGLRRIDPSAALARPSRMPPFYERHGLELVQAGVYSATITYRDHLLPLAQALLGRRCERLAA